MAGKEVILACSISYGLFVVNTGYKVGSLLYVLLSLRETPLHQIMIHGIVAVTFVVMAFWYYVIFVKHADVHSKVFGITLTGNVEEDTGLAETGSFGLFKSQVVVSFSISLAQSIVPLVVSSYRLCSKWHIYYGSQRLSDAGQVFLSK